MKNKITFTFFLAACVVAGLLGLYYLPSLTIGNHTLRKVDILSDLHPEIPEVVADSDTVVLPPPVKPVFVDTCKGGMVCIEDYSDSTMRGMSPFYEALLQHQTLGRPVRIAYFGDSYIEADILTADLRALLQQRFGGCGVGYVPITSATFGFRPTVKHSFSGWESHSITDSTYFDRDLQDISNHYFIPRTGATVTLQGQKKYAVRLDTCEVSALYFQASDSVRLTAVINGSRTEHFALPGKEGLQAVSVNGRIGNVKWTVDDTDSLAVFYAATMDPQEGVVVDNFSTRGSSGQQLRNIPYSILADYNRLRTYDLIVLQYGLNVASEKGVNYSYYKDAMIKVVAHLKAAFPQAGILIVGVGDRENKNENGDLRTMPGVKNLIRYQQALAAEAQVAFWNLFEAMGGDGSIVRMVEAKPSQANLDYTHINFRGGKHLAEILFETLMYGKEQYEKRKAYEAE